MRFSAIAGAIALAALSLAGCAGLPSLPSIGGPSLQSIIDQLGAFTLKDVQKADALAVRHGDTLAHLCFASGHGLQKLITDEQVATSTSTDTLTVSGAISAFESARITARSVGTGLAAGATVPNYLLQDCAPLVASVKLDAANFLGQLAAFGLKP